jgi:outer membrane protein
MLMHRHGLMLLVLLTTCPAWPTPAAAQARATYSLDDAQRLALAHYETIQAQRERTAQAADALRVARSYLLPQIASAATFTENLISAELNFSGQAIRILPPYDYNLTVSVSQSLYSGQRIQNARAQAALGVDVAASAFEVTAQDTLLEVTRAFYDVLGAEDNIEITRRSLAFSEETLRSSDSLYKAGEAVETTVLRSRVAVSDARRQLLVAENELTLAKAQLRLLTGIQGDYAVVRPDRPRALGQPLEALITIGLGNRRELQALALQKKIAELEVDRQKGSYLPSIDAQASYLQRRSNFPSNHLSSISVNATWLVFNGSRTPAQVAAARSSLREVAAREELARKQVELQIQSASLAVDTLSASVAMLTAQVEFARQNAESTARAFKVGEATDLDVLDANASLTRSERQLAVASYSLDVATYALQRAVGTFAVNLVPVGGGVQ